MEKIIYNTAEFNNTFDLGHSEYISGSESHVFSIEDNKLAKIYRTAFSSFATGDISYANYVELQNILRRKKKKLLLLDRINKDLPGGLATELIYRKQSIFKAEFVGFLMNKIVGDSFYDLINSSKKLKEKIELLILAESNIKKFHGEGIALVDIHGGNIIGQEAKLIDLDNCSINGLAGDIKPDYARYYLEEFYKGSEFEGDMFSFAILALSILTGKDIRYNLSLRFINMDYLEELLQTLPYEYQDLLEYFRILLSKSKKNEYITPVLKSLKYPSTKITL